MKILRFIAILIILPIACKNIVSITPNEDKGVKDILNFYGGYCKYSLGVSASTDEGAKKFFELQLSKSEVVEKYADMPDVSAANIAYLFYNDLKQERKNYDEIHCVLLFNKRDKYEGIFSMDTLALISSKMKIADQVVGLIKNKKFDDLKPLFSSNSYTDSAKNAVIANIKKLDPTFGNIKEFMPLGFRFETVNGIPVLDILGAMMRDKQNNQFTLKVDASPSENKVHYLDYKF
jgi:hypothetical protein